MISNYFGDVEKGEHPCINEEISNNAWLGIRTEIEHRIEKNGFSINQTQFCDLLQAHLPKIEWPLPIEPPKCNDLLELIQFCYKFINRPLTQKYKELSSDDVVGSYGSSESAGQAEFRDSINLIFYRNSVTYRLEVDGSITRSIPTEISDMVLKSIFQTDDPTFNELMDVARRKFLDPDIEVRKESLEKLWDAWERLKTFEGDEKKESMPKMLQKVSPEIKFFSKLEKEANELTEIGNTFFIRHTEKVQVLIESPDQIDYLFYRLFSMIYLILRSTKRIE